MNWPIKNNDPLGCGVF